MKACPAPLSPPRRRRFALTARRIEANRRNAGRSTGPRSLAGKARVARNAVKHGFFVAPDRWTPEQQSDFIATYDGLREDFQPAGTGEESCVWTIAHSYLQMASLLRYESIAAHEYHQRCDRELEARIAVAAPDEAARLREGREELRRAGLWRPTIPAAREADAIMRYMGRLDRTIGHAVSQLQELKAVRRGGRFSPSKPEKQTHCSATPNNGPEALRGTPAQRFEVAYPTRAESQKTNPFGGVAAKCPEPLRRRTSATTDIDFDTDIEKTNRHETSSSGVLSASRRTSAAIDGDMEIAKTNPLTSMSTGNRHARRRAAALARQRT